MMTARTIPQMVRRSAVTAALALAMTGVGARDALAHCDTMDGPVVGAARKALEGGSVNGVLIWVRPQDEAEIRSAFQRALSVRKLTPEARELADRYFFETLVRVHRAGEGEPYTGLKPAGTDHGPVVPAADRALAAGSVAELEALLARTMRDGLRTRFDRAVAAKRFAPDDVPAGRSYVAAYVPLLHYAERVHAAAAAAADTSHGEGAHAAEKPAAQHPERHPDHDADR